LRKVFVKFECLIILKFLIFFNSFLQVYLELVKKLSQKIKFFKI